METKNTAKLKKIIFDDYQDLANYLTTAPDSFAQTRSTDTGGYCSYTWEESAKALTSGWTGAASIDGLVPQITERIGRASKYNVQYDVTGDFVDVGRFVSGEPECFGVFEMQTVPTESIKIVASTCISGSVPESYIFNRGAAILSLIDALRKTHEIDLEIHERSFLGKPYDFDIEIVLKVNMKNGYPRELIAFALCHSGFLRRILLRVAEQVTGKSSLLNVGYGAPRDTATEKGTIYFPIVTESDYRWESLESSAENIKNIIKERGAL